MFIFICYVRLPRSFLILAQYAIVRNVQVSIVLFDIVHELFCSECLGYLFQLVVVVASFEKWFLLEYLYERFVYHSCQHDSKTPDVEGVMVKFVTDEQLRAFIIP